MAVVSIKPKKLGKKPRLICRDCGCRIGRKNRSHLCLSCRAKRHAHPKPEFEATVRVVIGIDGKKQLVGGLQHRNEGFKEKREGFRVLRRALRIDVVAGKD